MQTDDCASPARVFHYRDPTRPRWIIPDICYTFPDIIVSADCVKSTRRYIVAGRGSEGDLPGAESTVRIGTAIALPQVLRELGANPAELLAEVGLDLALFDNHDNRISYAARSRLVAHCVAKTGCRHLGVLVGQHVGLHSLGLVGLLVKYSPDVGMALRSLVRYMHLHVRGAMLTLGVQGQSAMLGYETYQAPVEAADAVGDGAVAMMANILRDLCGRERKPVEVRFVHRRPEDDRPFRRFFGVPMRFDAEQYAVVFPADWMNLRLPDSEPELRLLLQKQIDELDARYGDDFPAQVRSVLRTALVTGHGRADQVAALFSMHSRTLNRRLKTYGTGFQELVDESLFQIARQMLEHSGMDVSQIAASLDYADASAFTRAFRRWSGTTPGRWRDMRGWAP